MKILLIICLLYSSASFAQRDTVIPPKKYTTQPVAEAAIIVDGIPNEEAWNALPWAGDFIQTQPHEGKAPTHPTRFKIAYDNRFLYVAYDCYDVSPDSISNRMGRRDDFPGDWVEINIDSYNDNLTAFSFTLSASGVRGDEFVSNNGNNWDGNWNPIWYGKTHINEKGWTAEIKIPLSQLRYGAEKEKVWGFQVQRRIFRKEERSVWQFIPQNSGVWVSAFGELHGLNNIPFHRQVEIAPYFTVQTDVYPKQPGNPFADGFDTRVSGGLDGKVAVTNDLILDFTVNPDFGQVEADPSQVRIDGFQNFFDERRPFFIESRNIFNYQVTGSQAGGDYDSDILFYSRRIGGSPHGYPGLNSGEFVDHPQNTSILGAAKFSGKTRDGWSIGVLESVTERERATIDSFGKRKKEVVEPLTNYFVGRVQKDINEGNTVIGGIFTAVNREKHLSHMLHRSAYTGGIDLTHFWKNRTWYVRGNFIYSNVNGTKDAILNTQRSITHLFQRPDAKEVHLDPERTSLTGTGATLRFGKAGGKMGKLGQVFRFETGATMRSPELELNDIGFMNSANEINHFTWAGLRFQRAFSVFRNAGINYNHWLRWDFAGKMLYKQMNVNGYATFRNNWNTSTSVTWNPYDISNTALRGAGAIRRVPGIGWNYGVGSDSRKKVFGSFSMFNWWGFDNAMRVKSFGASITTIPVDALSISLSANYEDNMRRQDQYVQNVNYNGITRSIVSRVDQKTIRVTTRMSYNVTPDFTIQFYGQPFITRPLFSNFAWVSDPLAKDYDARFTPFTADQISFNAGQYSIDEDRDGTIDYSFGKPDFNFVQFRSNLILRWEYRPGSEMYFVWASGNTADAFGELDTPIFQSLLDNAFEGNVRNSFLFKVTYRFLK